MGNWFRNNIGWRFGKRPTVEVSGLSLSTKKGEHIKATNTTIIFNMGAKK